MIRMLCGVFGLPVVDGDTKYIKKMDKDSEPFEAGNEQERRLVALGLAEYVVDPFPIGFDEMPTKLPDDEEPDEAEEKPLEELTAKELREIGKEYGLTFKANMTKAQMIEAIKAEWPEPTEDDSEEEEPDEDAPEFDASEAVQ